MTKIFTNRGFWGAIFDPLPRKTANRQTRSPSKSLIIKSVCRFVIYITRRFRMKNRCRPNVGKFYKPTATPKNRMLKPKPKKL